MSRLYLPAVLALGIGLSAFHAQLLAGDQGVAQFGVIKGPSFEQAKAQTLDLFKECKDAATLEKVEALWNPSVDRPLLERVAESIALGDPQAKALLSETRDPSAPAAVPEVLKDAKRPAFVRANLGLYFAKQLAGRRVNDEALETLRAIRPEQVVDPASYYFFRAVAENRLLLKEEGLQSVDRLLNSVADVPERYTVLAGLMKQEMQGWKDKDLGYVARRMEEVEGRLDIARGGPKTQAKQKEIIDLLEQEIKELEAQCQQMMMAQSSNAQKSNQPLPDSRIMGGAGPGNVDKKRLLKTLEVWGKMPEKEQIKAYEAIKRDLPPYYQEAIEGYLKELARNKQK
jgi:hypothetical protein